MGKSKCYDGSEGNRIDKQKILELARFYREHLLDVISFWETRTMDRECGGYLTSFDRMGNLMDTDKYVWLQARQLWMFSALYNHVEKRRSWLDLARHGHDFIVKYAYVGNGHWNYQLDRYGKIKRGAESILTNHFALEALCEYAIATKRDEDLSMIRETYETIVQCIDDPKLQIFARFASKPQFKAHAIYMISLHVAGIVKQVLGLENTRPLIDRCLEEILYVFAKDDYKLLFEYISHDGSVVFDDKEGRLINPGHILESMWFCIDEGKKLGNRSVIERAIQIAEWAYRYGYDKEYGGIFTFLDSSGREPNYKDWLKERNTLWHEKTWWVHSEALYTLALMALEANNDEYFDWFVDLHTWCKRYFYDYEYGEWYLLLNRDGSPRITNKGGMQKAAYHLPRALMLIMMLFEEYSLKNIDHPGRNT